MLSTKPKYKEMLSTKPKRKVTLSTKPKCKDINKFSALDEKWYSLGTELEIDDEDLDELEEKYSDPHKRLIKMLGVWLKKGENPTYRTLLRALVNIGKRDVAESICIELELGLSLDILLKTTSQANQETGTKPNRSQGTTSSDPDSTRSQSKGDLPHISDSTPHSRSMKKSTSSVSCKNETSIASQSGKVQNIMLPSNTSARDSQMHEPMTSTADASSELAYKAMIHCHVKLIKALSSDILSISGILVANEFIPLEVSSKMLLPTLTPQEKATSLVIAITEKIKLVPDRFQELIKIFSEQMCTKEIVTLLSSHVKHTRQVTKDRNKDDVGVMVSTSQKYSVSEGHMYTAWASLDPDDKIDLEARLLTEAERIGEKFAHLCSMTRDSFEERGITPQVLADTLMDLTVYRPGSSCHDIIPLLEEGGALTKAQSVRDTFHALRPHMSFFNYEILQYLIERKESETDKIALAMFLENFTEFCKRHVFEVPFTAYSNGHQDENHNKKQKLHIKVTEHFKAAFLITSKTEALPSTDSNSQAKNICSSRLGINLGDAKNIQRKLASILDLNPSSLFLDLISEGSVLLTFLLPTCVSLAGLDNNPEIALLSFSGVFVLCGPPGVPELQELTPNSIIVTWCSPEYGCKRLAQYILYYQMKYEHEWQKVELTSLETHACVHNPDDGDAYVFKICTVSDAGTLQYSDESDPIVWSVMRLFTRDAISRCSEMLTLMLSSNNNLIKQVTTSLLTEGIISKEIGKQINLASTPNKKAIILVDAVKVKMQLAPENFEKFVQILSDCSPMYTMNIIQTVRSEFSGSVHYQYIQYLRWLYASLQSKDQSSNKWPPSATKKFLDLQ